MTVLAGLSTGRAARLDLGRTIARAFAQLRRNWRMFVPLSLILSGAPYGLVSWSLFLIRPYPGGLVGQALSSGLRAPVVTITGAVVSGCMIAAIAAEREGRRTSMRECLRRVAAVWRPLLALTLLKTAALCLPYVSLAAAALFGTVWSVTSAVLILEGGGAAKAFTRSAALTRGNRWRLFWVYVAVVAILWLVSVLLWSISIPSYQSGPRAMAWLSVRSAANAAIVKTLSTLLGAAWAATLYFELRTLKQGAAPEDLASAFD